MANVSKRERDRNIYSAATYFATVTRDAKKIAALYNTTERTIQRWAEEPQWTEMLDFLGYTGDRTFRVAPQRDVERDNADILDTARKLFLENAKNAPSGWKCAGMTAEALGISPRRVWNWSKRFGWWKQAKAVGRIPQ